MVDYNDGTNELHQTSLGMSDEAGEVKIQNATSNVKLPLSLLPDEVQAGDQVELTLVGVDKEKGVAYVDVTGKHPVTVTGNVPTQEDVSDTSSLLGPLDELKDMLKKASNDTASESEGGIPSAAYPGPDQL